ncbi:hypothetical protein D0C16_17900 [Cellvibrio sp. KY-GH-1]|nr:hypothetical protein D0C16_17900 [Cellvibrio sp. KY-GH-1]
MPAATLSPSSVGVLSSPLINGQAATLDVELTLEVDEKLVLEEVFDDLDDFEDFDDLADFEDLEDFTDLLMLLTSLPVG